jgi:alkylhydroperoxidase family enzyme
MNAPRVRAPEKRGDDPISASVLAHQPEALLAFMKLYGTLWSHGILDQSTKEMARIRNARTVDCGI